MAGCFVVLRRGGLGGRLSSDWHRDGDRDRRLIDSVDRAHEHIATSLLSLLSEEELL